MNKAQLIETIAIKAGVSKKEAEEVLSVAVQRKITIADACMMLDKSPDFMSGIAIKIEKSYTAGVIKEKQRDKLVELYSQYTRNIYNQNKKSKRALALVANLTLLSSKPTASKPLKRLSRILL